MATVTFPLTSAANEGCGGEHKSGPWPPGPGDFVNEDNDPGNLVFVSKYDIGNAGFENTFWRWDTSTIPDTASVTSANVSFYLATRTESADNFSLVADYYDFGGQPTVVGDLAITISSPIFSVDISAGSLQTGAVNSISITDLSGISKTGFTGIRIGFSTAVPTTMNALEIASFSSANQEARLDVTYTETGLDTRHARRRSRGGSW